MKKIIQVRNLLNRRLNKVKLNKIIQINRVLEIVNI